MARHRLATRIWWAGAFTHRAVHLRRRGAALGLPAAVSHARQRGADAHEVWHRRAEGALFAADLARGAALRDWLLRARGRHGLGRAADPRREGRRPLHGQRAESV